MPRTRLTAQERQEQLVAAAITAFSQGGYAGTTTDQVARLAGVSQPYVIRIFRTKQELFLAACQRATDRIEDAWRAAAAEEPTLANLGRAYRELFAETDMFTVLLQGFSAGSDPVIGEQVRGNFGRLYRLVQELTGATPVETRDFFSAGMLLTVLAAMRAVGPDAPAPAADWVTELMGTFD
ncbi:TetR/AcrR family transcriptional regulator [Actinoplanes sp. TBRC 11911]|uniref:TetR/AcrR family transcriptional regulator n=1 Tax=Actinoplanes sp. TBRC 11911 TaxID=2729386 RepID=UPI00145DAD66|nr:TetR/AcrR family transcriptional regulator [Actinoplanes sp. TBRC 11911]NMO51610.1 TetR/AcrR family transcriptional regulator [Actinoplanes sp. TBRC 11911]